ncbi:MAG: hypothetical protein J6Q87_06330 [Clostridia bacterium]|nr:hypothetical protein [Clostridia bacterium]
MLKQRFLKNSARVLTVSTALLFISNAILWVLYEFPSVEIKLGYLAKLPDLSVYIFTFLSYLALNDEKSAHRKIKDIKSQKKLKVLKGFLIFVFVSHFFKVTIQGAFANLNNPFFSVVSDIFMTVASFSFFLLLLSAWYFFRDKTEGKLNIIAGVSVIVSIAYTIIKFWLSQKVFLVHSFTGIQDNSFLLAQRIQYVTCLLQYAVNIVMFILVKRHYEKKEFKSEENKKKIPKQERPQVVTLDLEAGFGIDNVDDVDFSFESIKEEKDE